MTGGASRARNGCPSRRSGKCCSTAFVPTTAALDRVFAAQHKRTVAADNTVAFGKRQLQLGASPLRCHCVRCRVVVHEHLDDTLSITYGPHVTGRFDATGQPLALEPDSGPASDRRAA